MKLKQFKFRTSFYAYQEDVDDPVYTGHFPNIPGKELFRILDREMMTALAQGAEDITIELEVIE